MSNIENEDPIDISCRFIVGFDTRSTTDYLISRGLLDVDHTEASGSVELIHVQAAVDGSVDLESTVVQFATRIGALFDEDETRGALSECTFRDALITISPNGSINANLRLPPSLIALAVTHALDLFVAAQ